MRKDKVLCLISFDDENYDIWDQENWIDDKPHHSRLRKELILPLIDHLHNDKENGQEEPHYHVDTRCQSTMIHQGLRIFPKNIAHNHFIAYRYLVKIRNHQIKSTITPVEMISNSKLKHKCIHKGKCPHRGFDLTNEIPDENGVITCPLHGLKFKASTKDLIR